MILGARELAGPQIDRFGRRNKFDFRVWVAVAWQEERADRNQKS